MKSCIRSYTCIFSVRSARLLTFTKVRVCPPAPLMKPMKDPVLQGGIWNLDADGVQVKRVAPQGEGRNPKRTCSCNIHELRGLASDLINARM